MEIVGQIMAFIIVVGGFIGFIIRLIKLIKWEIKGWK